MLNTHLGKLTTPINKAGNDNDITIVYRISDYTLDREYAEEMLKAGCEINVLIFKGRH